jgi:hypothetical protein
VPPYDAAKPPSKRHIHSLRRLDPVRAGTPCRHGKLIVHRLMRAVMIVKIHPQTDAVSRFAPVSIGFQMHFLVFDRAPQPFDENIALMRISNAEETL